MAFKLSIEKSELNGPALLPAGWYTLQFKNFRPKLSKDGESVSLNAELAVVSPEEHAGRRIFAGLNTKMAWMWPDFVHATGMEMEEIQDANVGTEKAQLTIPGVFDGQETSPDDPSKWTYQGPLLNATLEVELAEIPEKDGYKAKNEIRQYKCAVEGCTMRHSTNLIRG